MDAHPATEVNVIASSALADFARDDIDIAIRFGRGPWPPLACEMFLEDEFFPVASPRFNRGRLPAHPADMLKMRLIREDRDYWNDWFIAAGVPVTAPSVVGPIFNDATYSMLAAARGEGIAMARMSVVRDDLERGTLKRLFRLSVPARERYWFVSPREKADLPQVKTFRAWVKAELRA
jgi:LysR family glycine cleavage system transcriptional activator